jgi:hypothetical protein
MGCVANLTGARRGTAMTDRRLVPFGVDRWSMQDLAAGVIPCVAVDPGSKEPLRLYQYRTANAPAGVAPDEAAIAALKRLCRPYDRLAATFLDRYRAYLGEVIAANRPVLESKLAPFDGLYRVEDWIFSAPLPLPRAFLFAPSDAAAPSGDESDYVQVEFAFYPGEHWIAVLLQDGRMTPGKARDRQTRLSSCEIVTIDVSSEDLSSSNIFARIVPADTVLGGFGPLPVGPGPRIQFLN